MNSLVFVWHVGDPYTSKRGACENYVLTRKEAPWSGDKSQNHPGMLMHVWQLPRAHTQGSHG